MHRARLLEGAVHLLIIVVIALVIFAQSRIPLTFLAFPFLLLAVFRIGLLGASAGTLALAIVATVFTMAGTGPMAMVGDVSMAQRVHLLQIYLAVVAISVLPVAAVLEERRRLVEGLQVAKEAAESADRAKTDFLSAMSHEIRTPMTAVLGITDVLAKERLSERQGDLVRSIRISGQQLLAVINDILDFSRLAAGRIEIERIDFDLREQLEHVRSVMAVEAADRGLDLADPTGRGRSAGAQGRPDPHPTGALQPRQQRPQVHRARQCDRGVTGAPAGSDHAARAQCRPTPASASPRRSLPPSFARSPRPTPRPRAVMAAPASASPSASG